MSKKCNIYEREYIVGENEGEISGLPKLGNERERKGKEGKGRNRKKKEESD
jgi:hypothetical protein